MFSLRSVRVALNSLAISRIYLENIENIQSSWVTPGLKTCQLGLRFGGNDVGSIMIEENVVSAAGAIRNLAGILQLVEQLFFLFLELRGLQDLRAFIEEHHLWRRIRREREDL